ncbi:hypothetical protein [Synechococcus sp. CCY 0621]|uniref:hypothetical protein n=1 Tax=Synechococcus sp. CCY 0621 TaxID=2815603 RepID=UPI001C211A5A|nr:hypothetical protein [Synechococcus sp. CCY 0621]
MLQVVILIYIACAGLLGAVNGSSALPIPFISNASHGTFLADLANWANPWQPVVLPILSTVLPLLEALARSSTPWKWVAIQSCLDEFARAVYSSRDHQNDFEYQHRATIYRVQYGCVAMLKPPWHKYFVPIARSGTVTKNTRSIFRFSDHPNDMEGVVGQAWCMNGRWVEIKDVPTPHPTMTDKEKQDYFNLVRVPVDKAIEMNYNAKAYAAISIELNGKRWGVLILDSTNTVIPKNNAYKHAFRVFISAISPILGTI